MDLEVGASLREVDRSEFGRLGRRGGVRTSYDRLLQRESDRRFDVRYLRVRDGQELVGLLPLYAPVAPRLLDAAYDPAHWAEASTPIRPDRAVLLVAGSGDLRSSLLIAESHRAPAHMRTILDQVFGVATDLERDCVVFPYLDQTDRGMINDAHPGAVQWSALGREAVFDQDPNPTDGSRHRASKVAYVLRRDARLIEAAGTEARTTGWSEVEADATQLIADNNARHGQRDHPQFVHMRHREWDACENADLVVFAARAGAVRGYLTAVVWEDELDLYEIGLTPDADPARTPVYLSLLIHQPRAFAETHGLRRIRAGLGSESPKSSRGARMVPVFGGVAEPGLGG